MEVRNKRLSDEEFLKERQEVLAEWPTGQECDLNEAVDYHRSMPASKNYPLKLLEAKRKGEVLLSVNSGRCTVASHIELLRYCQEAGADLLTTWIDAMTRNHRYEAAEKAVEEAERTGKQVLNGFPVVHYGVTGTRKIIEAVDRPVAFYPAAPDLRLVSEIAIAAGLTGVIVCGPITATWQYSRNVPPEMAIRYFQYIYRLVGHYEERGVALHCATPSGATHLVPPSMAEAPSIITALIAAEQGVKHIPGGAIAGGSGNLAQDLAVCIVSRKLCREYLNRLGYKDVVFTEGGAGGIYGRWPTDPAQAFARICYAPLRNWLVGGHHVVVTSLDEARAIPVKENNAASLRCARMFVNLLKDQKQIFDIRNNKEVKIEAEVLEQEMRAILDRVIELGEGDVVVGTIRAFEAGVLDHPWATNTCIAGKVMGVRDAQGALRWFDHGNLPFSPDIIDFHKEKIAERSKALGREVDYSTVVADLVSLSQGSLLPEPWWEEEEAGVTA